MSNPHFKSTGSTLLITLASSLPIPGGGTGKSVSLYPQELPRIGGGAEQWWCLTWEVSGQGRGVPEEVHQARSGGEPRRLLRGGNRQAFETFPFLWLLPDGPSAAVFKAPPTSSLCPNPHFTGSVPHPPPFFVSTCFFILWHQKGSRICHFKIWHFGIFWAVGIWKTANAGKGFLWIPPSV